MKKSRTVILLTVILSAVFLLAGCGVSHNSPEGVVQSLIKAYDKGNIKRVLNCYDLSDGEDPVFQEEAEEVISYFDMMGSKGVSLEDCNVIQEYEDYDYIYIYYLINLKGGSSYPKMSTFFVSTADKNYYIMSAGSITSEMGEQASSAYADFMTSQVYLDYEAAYLSFIQENPGFEESLVEPSEDILDEPTEGITQDEQTDSAVDEQTEYNSEGQTDSAVDEQTEYNSEGQTDSSANGQTEYNLEDHNEDSSDWQSDSY